MTNYKGPNAFSSGLLKPAKAPKIIPPYQRAPDGVARNADGPAFNNRFPKSRYQGGGQSGLRPVLEVAGGGGGGYVAKAVHFDGSIQGGGPTYLLNNALTASNSGVGFYSIWFKDLITPGNAHAALFQSMVSIESGTYCGIRPGVNGDPAFANTFADSTGANQLYDNIGADAFLPGWNNFLSGASTNHSAGTKVLAQYINDVLVNTVEYPITDEADAFLIGMSGLPFVFGDDTFSDGPSFDVSDVIIGCGTDLLSGSTIPEATRRLFISATGKPVDPATAIAELGNQVIMFSGDATTFGTNQGTGGTFTTTGTLTNATTSPSD